MLHRYPDSVLPVGPIHGTSVSIAIITTVPIHGYSLRAPSGWGLVRWGTAHVELICDLLGTTLWKGAY